MSTARERLRERRQIMNEVMINHPAISGDPRNTFKAKDVAFYPQQCTHDVKEASVKRADNMLKTFGCLVPRRLPDGAKGYFHARSPTSDPKGVGICEETHCIFHKGDKRGVIPMVCPDEAKAVKRKGEQTPTIRVVPTDEPKQLPLF